MAWLGIMMVGLVILTHDVGEASRFFGDPDVGGRFS